MLILLDCSEDLNGELPNVSASEIQQMSPRKQKIPSKKNPPLLLDGWLKTFQVLEAILEAINVTNVFIGTVLKQ